MDVKAEMEAQAQTGLRESCTAENTYEEVEPAAVIEARTKEDGTREFLMRWADGEEDSWVAEKHVSVEVMNDFDQGLEYAEAEEVLEERTDAEGSRELLVRWKDTREEEWVPEVRGEVEERRVEGGVGVRDKRREKQAPCLCLMSWQWTCFLVSTS